MAEATDTAYLSIGEVLGLLLEEFPDVTISKIRFLESQGLISPERTSSGYRKFYGEDVDLLRVILTEQRTNYLPLRVIKDRLDSGEIDRTGEHLRPNGDAASHDMTPAADDDPSEPVARDAEEVPSASIRSHPASRAKRPAADTQPAGAMASTQLLPSVLLDRAELCGMVGMTDAELGELESFSIVAPSRTTGVALYGDDAVEIAKAAVEFLRAGVDARHLRNWRTSAEREASLYEQLVTPRFRQRNPEARAAALSELQRLDALGARLRAAMTRQALRHHFES
ncbi:MAG TPA: MerR family transcriptional regulator [Ilumatobacter sp.]